VVGLVVRELTTGTKCSVTDDSLGCGFKLPTPEGGTLHVLWTLSLAGCERVLATESMHAEKGYLGQAKGKQQPDGTEDEQ